MRGHLKAAPRTREEGPISSDDAEQPSRCRQAALGRRGLAPHIPWRGRGPSARGRLQAHTFRRVWPWPHAGMSSIADCTPPLEGRSCAQWTAAGYELIFERRLTAVDVVSGALTLDAPIVQSLDASYGGATVTRATDACATRRRRCPLPPPSTALCRHLARVLTPFPHPRPSSSLLLAGASRESESSTCASTRPTTPPSSPAAATTSATTRHRSMVRMAVLAAPHLAVTASSDRASRLRAAVRTHERRPGFFDSLEWPCQKTPSFAAFDHTTGRREPRVDGNRAVQRRRRLRARRGVRAPRLLVRACQVVVQGGDRRELHERRARLAHLYAAAACCCCCPQLQTLRPADSARPAGVRI